MKVLISLLIFLSPLLCLEAKKNDKKPLDINLRITLSHDWIDFAYSKPNYDEFVLLYFNYPPIKFLDGRAVGKLSKDDDVEYIMLSDGMRLPIDGFRAWMLLPDEPK